MIFTPPPHLNYQSDIKMAPIAIVYCSDSQGADFMLVAIKSALHNNPGADLDIHILSDNLPPETLSALSHLQSTFGCSITTHFIDSSSLDGLPVVDRPDLKIPLAMYFRFFIGDALPASVSRVLYLDTDTIVDTPLDELWLTDLGDNILAAVAEPFLAGHPHLKEIGLGQDDFYFNSGMMLIDLNRFRAEDIGGRCLDWVRHNPDIAVSPDQDALNAIVNRRVLPIHPRYNLHYTFMLRTNYGRMVTTDAWDEALSSPAVIHFSGCKPWLRYHWGMKSFFTDRYTYYRDLSPATHVNNRPVVKLCSRAGYIKSLIKNSVMFRGIYRLCPGFWSRMSRIFPK